MSLAKYSPNEPLSKKLKNHHLIVIQRVLNGLDESFFLDDFEKDCLASMKSLNEALHNYNDVQGNE